MKIVISKTNDPYLQGIIAAMALSHDVIVWEDKYKPFFDMMEELKPNIVVCQSHQITAQMFQTLQKHNTKLIVDGLGNWTDIKPDLILFQNKPSDIVIKNLGDIKYYCVERCANTAQYRGGSYHKSLKSDVLVITDDFTPEMEQDIWRLIDKYQVKIVGKNKIHLPTYLGNASHAAIMDLMKSTKIALDYNEHMLYNYIYNSVFCITSVPNQFCWYGNDVVQLVDKYIDKPQCRQNKKKKARQLLLKEKRVYEDKVVDIFNLLGNK